jgi:hypothetical protein|tara:strand:- start:13022 stop:13423 length:402 start_codon:yes stop_codon:yes gene_type:complete
MAELTVDAIVETYITLRSQKEAIEAETKDRLVGIKEKMHKLETWIQAKSDETGVKSFKTDHGTAFLTTSDFASVADWDAVLAFVKENDAYDMLTRGVSKRAVRGYIDANKAVPDGVNFGTKIGVSVRRPAKKI